MLDTIKYYFKILGFWLLLFFVAKVYFLIINGSGFSDFSQLRDMWFHGLRLDISVIGYLLVLPILLSFAQRMVPLAVGSLLKVYWWTIFLLVVVILAVDPYFFLYWGQKTNLGFTQFLGKENAGLSSIDLSTYITAIGVMALCIVWFAKWGKRQLQHQIKIHWLISLLLLPLSFLMIRGSVDKVPINLSSAYYSSKNVYNNTAVNAVWSFMVTEFERDKHKPMVFFDSDEEAQLVLKKFKNKNSNSSIEELIANTDSKNVILIVLESFSAKTVGFINGATYGSTPELDKIMGEGIAYTSAYAASFRSDKGLLALTTGIASGARQTLTNFPEVLANKPNIFNTLSEDYTTGFYYGGNLEFANIKVLFKDADVVKSQQDFTSTLVNAWGVHDEDVFRVFAEDFVAEPKPQFKMLFSLSSHEPFDVPNYNTKKNPYLNSIAYTDSCLGVLIGQLKASPKWGNTLVIITADHGTIRPDNAPIYDTANFKIPLVLTGGVVLKDTVVHTVVSQAHIPATIAQYASGSNPFLQPSLYYPAGYAFYSYHIGVSYVANNCTQYYDIIQKKYLNKQCDSAVERAYYQLQNSDFFTP